MRFALLLAVVTLPLIVWVQGCLFTSCTEVACDAGLNIVVQGAQGQSVEIVDGTLEFDGESIDFSCTGILGPYECSFDGEVFLIGVQAREVTLTLRDEAGQVLLTETFSGINYKLNEINGPGCDPNCLQASVTATLP